jgi:apolipoprotein N-acyltransferase
VFAASVLSAGLLLLSFAPFDLWILGWFALVPWGIAIARGRFSRRTILAGWLAGVLFWGVGLYWLVLPTVAGYLASVVYLSLYWLAMSWVWRAASRRGWSAWWTWPIVWVGLEFLRAFVLSGFTWFYLGHSQYRLLPIIQIADLAGELGVSFLLALSNGVLIDVGLQFLSRRGGSFPARALLSRRLVVPTLVLAVLLTSTVGYGRFRLSQDASVPNATAPRLGVVQEALPNTLSAQESFPTSNEVIERHIRLTMDLWGEQLDAILWPETMLPMGLNYQILMIDLDAINDASVRSLARLWVGPETLRKYSPDGLREGLRNSLIGAHPVEAYQPAMARLFVHRFLSEDDRLAELSPGHVRLLFHRTFEATDADTPAEETCRAMLRLWRKDVSVETLSPELLRRAWTLLLRDDPLPDEPSGPAARLIERVHAFLNNAARQERLLRAKLAMLWTVAELFDCPLIAGATAMNRNPRPVDELDHWVMQNGVIRIDPAGMSEEEYAKIHLVPVSEYVPWKYSWRGAHRAIRSLVPPVMPQLQPGERITRFVISDDAGRQWDLLTPVCFEGTFGRECRMLLAAPEGKDRAILVNLSNDGWFVYRRNHWLGRLLGKGSGEDWLATTELRQHLVHSVFRAVELRVPVVRAVNTGISAQIDSDGRIVRMLQRPRDGQPTPEMIRGSFVVSPLVDWRISLYSLHGDVFGWIVSLPAVGLLGWLIATGWSRRRRTRTTDQPAPAESA